MRQSFTSASILSSRWSRSPRTDMTKGGHVTTTTTTTQMTVVSSCCWNYSTLPFQQQGLYSANCRLSRHFSHKKCINVLWIQQLISAEFHHQSWTCVTWRLCCVTRCRCGWKKLCVLCVDLPRPRIHQIQSSSVIYVLWQSMCLHATIGIHQQSRDRMFEGRTDHGAVSLR